MKYITIVISILLFFTMCNSNDSETTVAAESNPIKENKVKQIRTYKNFYKFGVVDTTVKENQVIEIYDLNGRLVSRKWILSFENDTNYIKNEYVKVGEVLTQFIYQRRGNEEFRLTGKLLYDRNDREIEYVSYDEKGDIDLKTIKKYDGNKKNVTEYDSQGSIISKSEIDDKVYRRYDRYGNILEEETLIETKNGVKYYAIKDTLGARKRIIVDTDSTNDYKEYDSNGNERLRLLRKLSKKLPIEELFYKNGEPILVTKSTYEFYK